MVSAVAFKISALAVSLESFCTEIYFFITVLGWWRKLIFFHLVFFLILYEPAIPSCLEYPSRKENFQNYSWKALLLLHGATFPERSATNWHCKEYSYILHISICVCVDICICDRERHRDPPTQRRESFWI